MMEMGNIRNRCPAEGNIGMTGPAHTGTRPGGVTNLTAAVLAEKETNKQIDNARDSVGGLMGISILRVIDWPDG